ncbi:MAG: 6-bladed beta-propeller [Gemmatimonadota bacterium]
MTRDTLPGGIPRLRYERLDTATSLTPDLKIGSIEGGQATVFGAVKGIEADRLGNIYILDGQASEIRVFDPSGVYLRTIASPGEGPGELTAANGMILMGDSLLWVQDHGKWMMLALSTDGQERRRVPMVVRSYGYAWTGTVDERGRHWKPASHSDVEPVFPPPEGLQTTTYRRFLKWYDPPSEATDSVDLGPMVVRTYVISRGRGAAYWPIPHDPLAAVVVDPGGGFWRSDDLAYRLVRLSESGDTTLVVEVGATQLRTTAVDRERFVEGVAGRRPESRREAEQVADFIPELRPWILGLGVDDRGRVWVDRVMNSETAHHYDVFERDGRLVGSVELDVGQFAYVPIRVRSGHLYSVVTDSLDVQYVVRVPLPQAFRTAS